MARRCFVSGKMGPIEDPFVGRVYEVNVGVDEGKGRIVSSRHIEPLIAPKSAGLIGPYLFRSVAHSLQAEVDDRN